MHDFPKPYQEVDEQTERVVRACYASLLERGTAYDGEELRFNERVDDSFLQRMVQLRLISSRGDPGYRPTVVGLLYLPEAERDLQALDGLVRLAHQRYRPHAPPLDSEEVRKTLHLDQRDFDRLGNFAQDLGFGWLPRDPGQPARQISLYEWMAKVPDLSAALLDQLGSLYRARAAAQDFPAPAAFDLRPRSLRVRGFRALRDVELSTPGLTALVGPMASARAPSLMPSCFCATRPFTAPTSR